MPPPGCCESALKNRPLNTSRAYTKAQRLWADFCKEWAFSDGDHVRADKLLMFTQEVVLKIVVKKGKGQVEETDENESERLAEEAADAIDASANPDPAGAPLKYNTARGYISAVLDIYNRQIALKLHNNPNPRGLGVKGHLKELQASTHERIRAHHEDRAIGTILDGYSLDTLRAFVERCWEPTTRVEPYLRTSLDFLIGHFYLLRGQLRRTAELADMFVLDLPSEGVQTCRAWVFIFDNGKTNNTGKKQYLGAMRHKDVTTCVQGALAQYLFWRFHVGKQEWPDFSSSEAWDTIKLLRGSDPKTPLDESTHRKWIRDIFNEIGHKSSQTTHAGRKSGAQCAEIAGVSEEEIRRAGRWNDDIMSTTYLTSLPRKFMRIVAGHYHEGRYFLARAQIRPPDALLALVFPQVEEDLGKFRDGTYESSLSGQGFLLLMKHMKEIFLQDSVLLRERWPNHPNFQQPLFRSAEFNDFAKKVLAACRDPQVSYNQQIHSVVPELALELQALRREVHSDLEVFRRDWQLGHQHELRQLTGLAGMLHGATINLPAVVAPINFPPCLRLP